MATLNANGRVLRSRLMAHEKSLHDQTPPAQTAHIVGVGRTLSAAYEQLRNAAEYTEEHLLLQKAIARFFRRLFALHNSEDIAESGHELVVELTLAGYIKNDSVPLETVQRISALASQYYKTHLALEKKRSIPQDTLTRYTIEVLSVRVEQLFNDHTKDLSIAEFAYRHFLDRYAPKSGGKADEASFTALLYGAVLSALLHADQARIRSILIERYGVQPDDYTGYLRLNRQIDNVFESEDYKKIYHLVNRHAAPDRILRQTASEYNIAEKLNDTSHAMSLFAQQIGHEYTRASRRIDRAITKSVVFLFVTKVLIGIAIEIPYDIITSGTIHWLPLAVNLFFPPLYMLLLRYTLVIPGKANTAALLEEMTELLYRREQKAILQTRISKGSSSWTWFQIGYGIFATIVLILVILGLMVLQFNWLHIVIFMVFVSTASFLGFRLSRIVRDLEVVDTDQSALATIRDFVYMPFVMMGQWLTRTYSHVNIIGTVLDMVIELPLKTILRLIRQWARFINERKDEL